MGERISKLKERLATIEDLKGVSNVLAWDQETQMPKGAVETRAQQMATLDRIVHEHATAESLGELIVQSEEEVAGEDPDTVDARLVAVARHDFDRLTKLPAKLVASLTAATARGMPAWAHAKEENDFSSFAPHLEKIVDLSLEKAEAIGYDGEPYDALLDEFEPKMLTSTVEKVFSKLRADLVPIARAISERKEPDTSCLHGEFDEDVQWDFGERIIKDFGYDFDRGRQDRSSHPFSIHFSRNDVRITTRVFHDFLPPALFGTLHEAGHAMYEQGVSKNLNRTPLAHGTSLGMHESQSRLWENQIGRSLPFWRAYYPELRAAFAGQFEDVPLEVFYRAINRVKPSLIRVEADEVTYNLHVMMRFELERALIDGDLRVKDLPEAWRDRMSSYLGVTPEDDEKGVLQDVHWSMGAIGYFPTYTLGTLMSSQIFEALLDDIPEIDELISRKQFGTIRTWLTDRIYTHGRTFTAIELLEQATGEELDSASWLTYIKEKFGAIYGPLD